MAEVSTWIWAEITRKGNKYFRQKPEVTTLLAFLLKTVSCCRPKAFSLKSLFGVIGSKTVWYTLGVAGNWFVTEKSVVKLKNQLYVCCHHLHSLFHGAQSSLKRILKLLVDKWNDGLIQ